MRTAVKKVIVAVEAGDVSTAQTELPKAVRALGKAHTHGVVHKNYASRKISRLTRKVSGLVATQS
jgi:small subunit ribosomal protein S20